MRRTSQFHRGRPGRRVVNKRLPPPAGRDMRMSVFDYPTEQRLPTILPDSFQRWVDPFDQDQSLDERARSYLAINCAHCHAPDGPASTSGLYLGLTTPEGPSLGICKIPVAAGRGSGGRPFNIVPGDPDQSILLFRMESQESDIQMPELGRGLVDTDALGLVSDWITSLTPGVCSP